jgi:hypothetical protein
MPNSNPAEAELILKLYDLRREATMRKARDFVANFWPTSVEDIKPIFMNFGSPENAYFRQVITYWEMAGALVLHGAINEDLFHDTQGELWFVFSKFRPFLAELREFANAPEFMKNIEAVATRTDKGKKRVADTEARIKKFRDMAKAAAK